MEILTTEELAERLKVPLSRITVWQQKGLITPLRLPGTRLKRWHLEDVVSRMEKNPEFVLHTPFKRKGE